MELLFLIYITEFCKNDNQIQASKNSIDNKIKIYYRRPIIKL